MLRRCLSMGKREALRMIETLASGDSESLVTREARMTLARGKSAGR